MYVPFPLSSTWKEVAPAALRKVPSVMLAVPEHSARLGESANVTLNPRTRSALVRVIVTGTVTQLSTVERALAGGWAATIAAAPKVAEIV